MSENPSVVADYEQEEEMLDAIGKWLKGSVCPHVRRLEHADEYPLEMVEQMKVPGLFGATIGSEYGGLGLKACIAKYFASETASENAAECRRIHRAYGYSKELQVERYYRDAPLTCIGEGTNEMQRIILARQLIARNPA